MQIGQVTHKYKKEVKNYFKKLSPTVTHTKQGKKSSLQLNKGLRVYFFFFFLFRDQVPKNVFFFLLIKSHSRSFFLLQGKVSNNDRLLFFFVGHLLISIETCEVDGVD